MTPAVLPRPIFTGGPISERRKGTVGDVRGPVNGPQPLLRIQQLLGLRATSGLSSSVALDGSGWLALISASNGSVPALASTRAP